MERVFGLAALAVIGGALAVGLVLWRVVSRVGEARVYSDLTTWALVLTLVIGGIVLARVLLTGFAKLSVGRNAHKAQLVERHTIERERHTIDGRPAAPQIVALDRPADLRSIYPDAMRAAIEAGRPAAQIEAPDAYAVDVPAMEEVWGSLETLFKD